MLGRRLVACLAATLSASALLTFEPGPAAGQDEPPPPEAPAEPDAPDAPEAPADPDAPDTPEGPGKPRGKRDRAPARPIDTDSPVARALDELLFVAPNYSIDGTVELVYDFKDEAQLDDWTQEGLDQAEGSNARGRQGRRPRAVNRGPQALSLGAASNPGLFVHRLELAGDYEVTFRLHTERTTTRSELIMFAGKAGSSWGSQLVQRGTRGWTPVGRVAPDKGAWTGGRVITVTLTARGDELVTSINGARRDATTRLADKLAGRVGLYLTDMHLVVDHVTIKGRVDPAKL